MKLLIMVEIKECYNLFLPLLIQSIIMVGAHLRGKITIITQDVRCLLLPLPLPVPAEGVWLRGGTSPGLCLPGNARRAIPCRRVPRTRGTAVTMVTVTPVVTPSLGDDPRPRTGRQHLRSFLRILFIFFLIFWSLSDNNLIKSCQTMY